MSDVLTQARDRLTIDFDREPPIFKPLTADQWVVNSLLQKSIRRGEVNIAQRAALSFLAQKGSAIWRRFIIIAFEDVGVGCVDVVAKTVTASTDANWRKRCGGDALIASHLAGLLARATKSRSAEHLITTANHHPSLERERQLVCASSTVDNLNTVTDGSRSLVQRALAAWCVSGVGWKREKKTGTDLPGLLDAYRILGVPDELVVATGIAALKTRDAITLMVPLVWLAANDAQVPTVSEATILQYPILQGIPMYALDKHTRLGLEAIRNLAKYNYEIRECLERYVAPAQRRAAAYMAAFYADAAPLASKLSWDGGDKLEGLGTEADLLKVGVAPEGIATLLQAFKSNVQHLNEIRVHTVCKKRGFVDIPGALFAEEEG